MNSQRELELLIHSRYPIIAVETHEEERLERSLAEIAQRCQIALFVWTVTAGLEHSTTGQRQYQSESPAKALEIAGGLTPEAIFLFKDLHRFFDRPEVVRKLRDLAPKFTTDRRSIVLSGPQISLPPELERVAARHRLTLPDALQLAEVAQAVLRDLGKTHRQIRNELSAEQLTELSHRLQGLTFFEAERVLTRVVLEDMKLGEKDLDKVLEVKRAAISEEGLIEYHQPREGMADVGGLAGLKKWLSLRKKAFTPQAKKFGIPAPKGILLLGVQGCGKSLAARAVASEWKMPLLTLHPGRLFDKMVGESEKNLENVLRFAERMAPCVLMIDELEKGMAFSSSADADAGLSRRLFGRFLSWLQDRTAPVFVVATSNDVSVLPPELLRKGRFDEIFFVDLPTADERRAIFAVQLRRHGRDASGFDLGVLADASEGFSGSEIEQSVVSALYEAFSEESEVETRHVVTALGATVPLSVTRKEDVERLRDWARERAVPAGG